MSNVVDFLQITDKVDTEAKYWSTINYVSAYLFDYLFIF